MSLCLITKQIGASGLVSVVQWQLFTTNLIVCILLKVPYQQTLLPTNIIHIEYSIIHSEQFNWIDSYNWRKEEKTQDKLYHSYNQMVKKSKVKKENKESK